MHSFLNVILLSLFVHCNNKCIDVEFYCNNFNNLSNQSEIYIENVFLGKIESINSNDKGLVAESCVNNVHLLQTGKEVKIVITNVMTTLHLIYIVDSIKNEGGILMSVYMTEKVDEKKNEIDKKEFDKGLNILNESFLLFE